MPECIFDWQWSGPTCSDSAGASASAPILVQQLDETRVLLRTVQRQLGLGIWKMDLVNQALVWSPEVFEIYGLTADQFDVRYASYLELVYPDDSSAMQSNFETFAASAERNFQFEHSIRRPDCRVFIGRGIGERIDIEGRPFMAGVVQNVADQRRIEALAGEADQQFRIAGCAARLGAWRVMVGEERAPEDCERVRAQLKAVLKRDEPFDEMLQIVTMQGERCVVCSVGEAERSMEGRIISVRSALENTPEMLAACEASESLSRRLAQMLDHVSDACYLIDQALCVVYPNQRAERLLGVEARALIGHRLRDVAPGFPETLRPRYQKVLEDAQPQSFTCFFESTQRWYRINTYPVPEGVAVYCQDITGDRIRLQQLRLLEAAVSRTNDVLLITEAELIQSPDGPRIVYVNEALTRLTGYTADEVVGRSPRLLQGPKTQRPELDRIRGALERWEPIRTEIINYTKSGEEFWLGLDIVPSADEKGWFTHWVAIKRDIAERKNAEAAAHELNERFELISRATQDGIWDRDQRSGKVWWSRSFSRVFGFEHGLMPPSIDLWLSLLHPDDQDRVFAGLTHAVDGDGEYWEDEYRFIRADGTERHLVDRGYIIRDVSGKALRVVGRLMDVTERRELEERLRQPLKMEAFGQLTGGIAHDFNNLLTGILGNSELLMNRLEGEPALQPLADMTATAAQRGAELTQRLLAFGRRQALNPQVIQVNELLHRMDQLLKRSLGEQVEIQLDLAPGLWRVEVDPGQLETATLNLAINAWDAMSGGGPLTLRTANVPFPHRRDKHAPDRAISPCICISVIDAGSGMSPDVFRRAFTTTEVGKGSGLGLSMVYGLANQSGGDLWVDAKLGRGTSVHLLLSRSQARLKATDVEGKQQIPFGGQENILVAEDNELVRQHLIVQLKELGHQVRSAPDAAKGLTLLDEHADIDLLLTDIVMPGGTNGWVLAKRACDLCPGLKVLLTSGYAVSLIDLAERPAGDFPILIVPCRRHELAHKVRQALAEPAWVP